MSTIKESKDLMSQIFTYAAHKDWPDLIKFLHELDLENMESDLIVTAARSIYTCRAILGTEFSTFVLRAFDVLTSRKLNATRILKGLL